SASWIYSLPLHVLWEAAGSYMQVHRSSMTLANIVIQLHSDHSSKLCYTLYSGQNCAAVADRLLGTLHLCKHMTTQRHYYCLVHDILATIGNNECLINEDV
ncbi:hypothetical protein EDC04DRAFT_2678718, partial [Pisolithus marmoratus]